MGEFTGMDRQPDVTVHLPADVLELEEVPSMRSEFAAGQDQRPLHVFVRDRLSIIFSMGVSSTKGGEGGRTA